MSNHAEGWDIDYRAESHLAEVPDEGLDEPRVVQEVENAKRILTFYSRPDLIYTRYPRGGGPTRKTHDQSRRLRRTRTTQRGS